MFPISTKRGKGIKGLSLDEKGFTSIITHSLKELLKECSKLDTSFTMLFTVGDFRGRFFDRIGKILDLTDLPIEPLVYTIEEFEELKRSESPLIIEVLKTGVRIDT